MCLQGWFCEWPADEGGLAGESFKRGGVGGEGGVLGVGGFWDRS